LMVSKVNTLAQILLVVIVLGTLAINYPYPNFFSQVMIYIVAFTLTWSGGAYIWLWIETVNKEGR
jgi:phosphatidylglycerophosphate synthase